MPAPCIEPTDIENAVYQVLYRDADLYAMVAGKFYTGLDILDVPTKLGTLATAALINVSYFDDSIEAKHGSISHHLCTGKGMIQIDVAAKDGKRAASKIAVAARSLIYNDVNITIAGQNYDVSIGNIRTLLSYNKDASCWVAAVRASVEYDTEGE